MSMQSKVKIHSLSPRPNFCFDNEHNRRRKYPKEALYYKGYEMQDCIIT